MADTKHDIWNDDDGEGELKARSARKRRRVGLFLLVLGVVLAVVLVAAYRGGTGFDALRRLWSYQDGGTTETGAYAYEPSSQNRFAVLGEHLVVLSNTKLSVLAPDGTEVWSQAVHMAAPALVQAGDRAAAYDVGGTELYVVNREGELFHLSADEKEPLIAANLNEDGWLAVTAEKHAYKGCVSVYDPEMEQVFAFNSSQRFVTDACVSPGGKFLAAVTLGQEAGTFVSNVVLYDLSETEPAADYDVTDGLVAAITSRDGGIWTVSDTALTLAGLDGQVEAAYAYPGEFLRGYDLGSGEFTPLLLGRYRSGSVGRLVTVGKDGTELASLDVTAEVLDLSAAGRYLAVLYADELVIYNPQLQVYATQKDTGSATGVLMRADGSALLLSPDGASLFLP